MYFIIFAEREFHPFDLRLDLQGALSSPRQTPICAEIINPLETTRHIQYICSDGYVERLSIHIGVRTDQVTCYVYQSPSAQPFSSPSPIPKTLPINPQGLNPRATCPRTPLQPPHPRATNSSSTMPSKLTRRRPRKISVPIRCSTNSRTVILQMPSSTYFTNKFPGSTNLVVPMTI